MRGLWVLVWVLLGLTGRCLGQGVPPGVAMPGVAAADSLWQARRQLLLVWGELSEFDLRRVFLHCQDSYLCNLIPCRLPLLVEEGGIRLSSGFGYRLHPVHGGKRFHFGIDLAALPGQPVYSPMYGRIARQGYDQNLGYFVRVENPLYTLTFGHLSGLIARVGDPVSPLMAIGTVGSSGTATGPHLHYEIWHRGQRVDPTPYLFLEYAPSPTLPH